MSRAFLILLALAWVFLATANVASQTLQEQLNVQYHDNVLTLRHSFQSRFQEYGPDGTAAKNGDEGPWTLYGRIAVKEIKIDANQLRIEGKRALFFFDKNGNPVQVREDRKHPADDVSVTLHLQQPLASVDEAAAVLGRVFAMTPEEAVDSAPAYWRAFLSKRRALKAVKDDSANLGEDQRKSPSDTEDTGDNTKVFHLGPVKSPEVKAPKVLQQQMPDVSEEARRWRIEGVVGLNIVVDPTGRVRNIQIIHPLGLGLDEKAVATVSKWRFAPATKDGRPVAVAVYVEVDFHLD